MADYIVGNQASGGGTVPVADYGKSAAIIMTDALGNATTGKEHTMTGLKNKAHTILGVAINVGSQTIDNATYDATFFEQDCASGSVSIIAPSAATYSGQFLVWQKTDTSANTYTITGTFNGTSNIVLRNQYDTLVAYANGTVFKVIAFTTGVPAQGSARTAIPDPGTGTAIPVTQSGYVAITTAGSETNTLAIPTFIGQELCLFIIVDGGTRVITVASAINQAGNTIITMADVRDFIILRAIKIGSALAWSIASNEGCTLA